MNSNLQFDFVVDKENNTITVKREFAADQQLVWDAYTKSELLDRWFAPKPWQAKTKTMDFSEGGSWLYCMCGPNGEEHWGFMSFEKINPIDSYSATDGFCDEDGNINPQMPKASWDSYFKSLGDNTLVETIVTYESLEELETVIKMGMKEGLTMAMIGLDELLEQLKEQKA